MFRSRTKKTLTKAEQARHVKMLTAMGERLTRGNVVMFIAGVTPKVQVHNRLTLKEKRLDIVQATAVSVNRKHLLTLGWIATAGDFLDEEHAMKLFTSTGVWEMLDVAEVAEDLSVGVTQLLIDKVGE